MCIPRVHKVGDMEDIKETQVKLLEMFDSSVSEIKIYSTGLIRWIRHCRED